MLRAQRGAATAQRDAAKAQRAALATQPRHRPAELRPHAGGCSISRRQRRSSSIRPSATSACSTTRSRRRTNRSRRRSIRSRPSSGRCDAALAQHQTASDQVTSTDARVAQVSERIRKKSRSRNPIAGTVLTTYAKAGEVVQTGQPLYRIAESRARWTCARTCRNRSSRQIRLGQDAATCRSTPAADPRQTMPGTISWISSQAEFTPTPIQTRDERADLVYAIKIRVANQQRRAQDRHAGGRPVRRRIRPRDDPP